MAILTIGCLYSFLKVNRELTLKCIYIIYFVQLFYGLESLIVDRLGSLSEQNEIFNSNAGFSLISTLPMTLLLPIKRLRIYLYLLVVAACLASGQRSAALAAIISIPFSYRDIRDGIRKNDKVLITILLAIALVPIATFAYMNIMLRNAIDAEKGDIGSGRSVFWLLLIIDFFDKNVFHMIFGNGYFSTQALLKIKYGMGIEAHNGWLQNLYVFGFIGFIFYARTVFIMYKQNKFYNKIQNGVKNILLICFIIFFVKSSTSHGNWDISVMPFSLVIAMVADQIRIIKRASKSNDSNKNQSCITA
ncbi:MAG: O-antigen ligase family protein [Clostridia bacterium]|nr:O-antigen ligase family protein [Clostridia bacterium]